MLAETLSMDSVRLKVYSKDKFHEIEEDLFLAFRDIWKEAFIELDHQSKVYSDAILSSDYILILFVDHKIAAFDFLTLFELDRNINFERSWFSPWSELDVKKALSKTDGNIGAINSYFSVHQSFRKYEIEEVRISQLLAYFACLAQSHLGIDLMFGQMHNKRSVNKYCSHIGSDLIRKDAKIFNTLTDLMIFELSKVNEAIKSYPDIAHYIFNNNIKKGKAA